MTLNHISSVFELPTISIVFLGFFRWHVKLKLTLLLKTCLKTLVCIKLVVKPPMKYVWFGAPENNLIKQASLSRLVVHAVVQLVNLVHIPSPT